MAPKCCAEVLSSVPKCRKAMHPLEKTFVLDKLRSGMSYRVATHEFNVNKQNHIFNKHILNSNTHKTKLCFDQLIKKNVVIRSSQEPNSLLLL